MRADLTALLYLRIPSLDIYGIIYSMVDVSRRPIPRKLDDSLIEAICILVAKGNYPSDAALLAGVSDRQLYRWLDQAQVDTSDDLSESESIYVRLSQKLKIAKAESKRKLIEVVREAAEVKREWLPAMTFLERTAPDQFGRKDRMIQDRDVNISIDIVPRRRLLQVVEGEAKVLPSPDVQSSNNDVIDDLDTK